MKKSKQSYLINYLKRIVDYVKLISQKNIKAKNERLRDPAVVYELLNKFIPSEASIVLYIGANSGQYIPLFAQRF